MEGSDKRVKDDESDGRDGERVVIVALSHGGTQRGSVTLWRRACHNQAVFQDLVTLLISCAFNYLHYCPTSAWGAGTTQEAHPCPLPPACRLPPWSCGLCSRCAPRGRRQ